MSSHTLVDQLLVSCAYRGDNSVIVFENCIGGTDYVNTGPQTLVFNSGITRQSITLPLVDDSIFELTEMLQASLSFPGGDAPERVILDPDLASITVFDDDSESSLQAIFFASAPTCQDLVLRLYMLYCPKSME